MTASQIFDLIAPNLATDPNKNSFLTLAEGLVSECQFGASYAHAVALRAAHMLAVSKIGSFGGGAVTSKKEGDRSISYADPSSTVSGDPGLSSTSYGLQYMSLQRSRILGINVTGVEVCSCE